MTAHADDLALRDLVRREMIDWMKNGREILLPDGSPLFKRNAAGEIEYKKGQPIICRRRPNASEISQILKHLRQMGVLEDEEPGTGAREAIAAARRNGGLKIQPPVTADEDDA